MIVEQTTAREVIVYSGRRYRRYPLSVHKVARDYFMTTSRDRRGYLHRHVWEDANGSIPTGYHIHHINGDTTDNRLENLERVSPSEHFAKHPEKQDVMKRWHASEDGKKWHQDASKKKWEKWSTFKKGCMQCGSEFDAYKRNARFCAQRCYQRWQRGCVDQVTAHA